MRRLQVFAGLGLVVAITLVGWSFGPWGASPRSSTDLLVVDDAGTVQLMDIQTGAAHYVVPDAVVSPDRSSLFTTQPGPGRTHVESRDPETGLVTGTTEVVGDLGIRVVSPNAGAIALMAERPDGLGLYEPVARNQTSITVAYTDDRPSQRYELDGNYEPETFSLDEETLYLLEFQPPDDPTYYLVRELDLASGEVLGVKTPQVDLRPEMRGVARAQQVAPDGERLFTLYSIPADEAPVHDVEAVGDTERWAFVHVLDLELGIDFCIFLPSPMGLGNEASVGLALTPDGETLWVVDPSTSLVAKISTADLAVADVFTVPEIADTELRAEIAAADDGTLYVGLGGTLHQYAPGTLERSAAWQVAWSGTGTPPLIDSVSISGDGVHLRYSTGGTIVIIDRATGTEVASLRGPEGEDLVVLGPPSGTAVQIPLECAC